ncbi:MAG: exodeoxyribonuclease VII large subunit [Porcipelethomonas sp.]
MLVLSVSQLNRYIAFKLKGDRKLQGIMIRGEISNFTAHRSGHFYFTLKESESAVKAVMFRSMASKLKFMPEDGMSVIVLGSLSVFERDGVYQVYVTDIHPDGAGAVHVAVEQLKEKLRRAGIFDESHKRPLPYMPEKIGVVTSGTGAALQDIINILSRRYPIGELVIFPVTVQGTEAADSICSGISKAASYVCDVIIAGRGGGSVEDLSVFNTEKVAMAVYNCPVPVVSAVGHETDFTVTDLAADMRAPTPSAAAELVSCSGEQLMSDIEFSEKRLHSAIVKLIENKFNRLERMTEKIEKFSPEYRLKLDFQKLEHLSERLESAFANIISIKEKKFISHISRLEALSPVSVMCRGYSLVYRKEKIISDSAEIKEGDTVNIKLYRGSFTAQIKERTVEE